MKKGLLLLLVCVVLSSCQNVNDPSINTNDPDAPETIQGEGEIEFTTYEILKRSYNDIGDFFELELQLPIITGDYEGIADINRAFAELETYYEEIIPSEIYRSTIYRAEGKRDGYNISAFYQFETAMNDLISVSAYVEYNMAGGTGGASFEGRIFNLNTGERLDLSDLFKIEENEYMDIIYDLASEIILDDIEKNEGISPYSFDNPYSEEGKEMIRSFNQDDYYLTEDALVICYEKYALAAGASGPQKIEIPFTSLAGILDIDMNSKQQIAVNIDQEVKKAPAATFESEDFSGIYNRTNI